ncbi:adenosylcobinamide-GDP ribazoletransferase [Pacificoceanicola onchidii]|uniref:adenosylcobinamide-GDP ribazoletransferase n=1 Tax=Pacificoceanicola onchidii TaxID=2562685 RepID=UPI0010A4285D|nr:adenosylcobinamide-GDP ribazoletransferase [Pacificoceanicola onchidii]
MRLDLRLEKTLFLLAVQFLTRLPVPRDLEFSDDLLIRATKYYPAVGALIGGIGALVLWLSSLALPQGAAVVLSMAATILATGAFHEDGLADSLDGLGGGLTRERSLEIMRDSRIGTYGSVALLLALGLKASLLMALPVWTAGLVLIANHTVSRMAVVHVIATTDYARDKGAKFTVPTVTPEGYRVGIISAVLVLFLTGLWLGWVATFVIFAGSTALGQIFRAIYLRKLGGYTGDCLGGTQQLAELGALLAVSVWL